MKLFKRFKRVPESSRDICIPQALEKVDIEKPDVNKPPMPEKPKTERSCRFCKLVSSQGRSGEISGTFLDGDPYTAEIMNQTGVDGRECYTLFIQNDSAIGFNEMPIKFCPNCGRNLKRKS